MHIIVCVLFIPFMADVYFHFEDKLTHFLIFSKDRNENNEVKSTDIFIVKSYAYRVGA